MRITAGSVIRFARKPIRQGWTVVSRAFPCVTSPAPSFPDKSRLRVRFSSTFRADFDSMEVDAQLFSGLSGVLDRTASFTGPEGKTFSRTSADFLQALLHPDTGSEALLFFDGRIGATAKCASEGCRGSPMHLARVPLHALLSGLAGSEDTQALLKEFKDKVIVLGTLHAEIDSSTDFRVKGKKTPIAAVELKDLGEEVALTKMNEWLAASGCKCGSCGGALKATFNEGRKMLFEGANPCKPIGSKTATGTFLYPKDISWPITFTEAALFGMGRSLLVWKSKANFCSCCGGKMEAVEGGVKRTCLSCKQSAWQRTDPVVITAVSNKAKTHLLLGRQPAFPPSYYSALAGFLEPGESLEDCARREIKEESGISVSEVRYVSSQHWPIGRGTYGQLMLGCLATAAHDDIVADKEELEDCQWFSRADVEAAVMSHFTERERSTSPGKAGESADKGGAWGGSGSSKLKLKVPGPFAIAHALMQEWLRETAPTATK